MLGNITLGQYYPTKSFMHRLDPRTKILCTMIFIVGIFLADTWVSYGVVTAFVLLGIALSNLPLSLVWKAVKPLWIIIVFTMVIHVFTTPGTLVWQWGWLHVTEEGLRQGAMMTMRLVYLISFSALLTLQETERIMKAQKARGADFESGNLIRRGKALVPLMVPLFVSAFRRADELATAMEARCYRGGENRTRLHELHYENVDMVAFAGTIAVVLVLVILRWLH